MKVIQNTRDILNVLGISTKHNMKIKDFQINSNKITNNSVFFWAYWR